MHPALYWFAVAILLSSVPLYAFAQDRARLRAAWGLLALWLAVWISTLMPDTWRPGDAVVSGVAVALMELAAIQIAVVVVFDLLLRRVYVPKFAVEILIVAGYLAVLLNLLYKVGVNVTGIFATSAVAAAVVGLALQDMLSNIAGGIALELEGGINAGDFIECGEWSGWVRHIRLRHTALTNPAGDVVFLPNSHLTRTPVRVRSRAHRQFIPFSMPYFLDPHELVSTVEFALRSSPLPGVATDPPPCCVVRAMTPGCIEYAAVVWLSNPGHDILEVSAVLTRIYFALQRAGIPASEISTQIEMKSDNQTRVKCVNPVDVLRRTPILRLLEDPDLFELASYLQHLSFAGGEHIIRQGDSGDSMYFIVEGQVSICFSAEGIERQVSIMEPGDFFGEASLLTGECRNASAVALSRVDCYRLDKAGLQGLMKRLPELAEDMSVVMAHRQMELETIREKLARETARRREIQSQGEFLARIRRFFGTQMSVEQR